MLVCFQEFVDSFSLVPAGIVYEQAYSSPAFLKFSEEFHIGPLGLFLGELVDERFGTACAKDVSFIVLVVDDCYGL